MSPVVSIRMPDAITANIDRDHGGEQHNQDAQVSVQWWGTMRARDE